MGEETDEIKWLARLRQAILNSDQDYYCSWWLRLDYEAEKVSTTKINYELNKSVYKGILRKETTRSYTKYFFV